VTEEGCRSPLSSILLLPLLLIADACKVVTWLLVVLSHRSEQGLEQQTALLDVRCILWALQTSLDGPVRLSTLNYLGTTTLASFDLSLVMDYFNILFGCIKPINGKAVIAQGMEQLAAASSMCCLQTLSHLMAMDPTSRVLEETRRKYATAFPFRTDLSGLLS